MIYSVDKGKDYVIIYSVDREKVLTSCFHGLDFTVFVLRERLLFQAPPYPPGETGREAFLPQII